MVRQKSIEQGATPVACRRMHHQSGRLSDDQQVFVLIGHVQRDGLGHEGLRLQGRPQFGREQLAHGDLARGLDQRVSGTGNRTAGDQLLEVRSRKLGNQRRQHLVQTLAVPLSGHGTHPRLGIGQSRILCIDLVFWRFLSCHTRRVGRYNFRWQESIFPLKR